MKLLYFPTVLLLAAAGLFAVPTESQAKDRKITVLRDGDGDGHYNKKTIEVRGGDRHHGHYSYDNRYHGGRYYGGRSYGYPYRYGYGYPSYGPSVGVSYYSAPSYSYSYSRAYDYGDDTAVDVQRALKRRGYYRGAVDGDIGPGTRSAIRAYQYDRRLPATGRIDSSLLRSLGV
jgi:hypothetical protein